MNIIIDGTKGGYEIFTPTKLPGLLDVTPNQPDGISIGQEAYAIRLISDYTVFSKYKIIRDVLGNKRTGFVAFSLFLSKDEKLSGLNIIHLLEEVSQEYCSMPQSRLFLQM